MVCTGIPLLLMVEMVVDQMFLQTRAAAEVVANTHAILTLPGTIASAVSGNQLTSVALPFSLPALETHLYWHSQQEGEPGLMWLKSLMLQLFAESGLTS